MTVLLKLKLLPMTTRTRGGMVVRSRRPGSIVFMSAGGTKSRVVQVVGRAHLPHFRRPGTPHFMLASQRKGFTLNVNKCIQTATRCSFKNVIGSISFCPTLVPGGNSTSHTHGRFRVSVDASALFLGLIKRAGHLKSFIICATTGFHKSKGAFRLRGTCTAFLNFALKCDCNGFVSLTTLPPAVSFTNPGNSTFCHAARLDCVYSGLGG